MALILASVGPSCACKRGTVPANAVAHSRVVHCAFASRRKRSALVASSSSASPQALNETARLDELLDSLMACSDPAQFQRQVAENLLSFDQRFWLRIAARSDTARDEDEKQRLAALANSVMTLVDTMLKKTEDQLADSALILQDILRAAADENGEWTVPLAPEKLIALKQAMEERSEYLDEALLSNAFAWMAKAADDKLDGLVALVQKVLQVYAARALSRGTQQNDDDAVLVDIITTDDSRWEAVIRGLAEQGDLSETSFTEALQRKMESTVLGLESGSYAQRVQAEYLKELESRGKAVFASLSGL